MNQKRDQLWTALLEAGAVEGVAAPVDQLPESPWYVKLMLAFSGWLAAVFLLGFLGVGFERIFKSETACIMVGVVMLAGALTAFYKASDTFSKNLAMALSLAGQALIVYAVFLFTEHNEELMWVLVMLLEVVLLAIVPSFVHQVFSAFVAGGAFFMAATQMGAAYFCLGIITCAVVGLWLNEFRYPKFMKRIQACGFGLALVLVLLEGAMLSAKGGEISLSGVHRMQWGPGWLSESLVGAAALIAVVQLLRRHAVRIFSQLAGLAVLGTLLVCALSLEARGISVGVVLLLLGFAGSNRLLQGLGIASLLCYIGVYYYQLEMTLLAKSETLFVVGVVLLAVRYVVLQVTRADRELAHA